jgi:hypothetical protein
LSNTKSAGSSLGAHAIRLKKHMAPIKIENTNKFTIDRLLMIPPLSMTDVKMIQKRTTDYILEN